MMAESVATPPERQPLATTCFRSSLDRSPMRRTMCNPFARRKWRKIRIVGETQGGNPLKKKMRTN